MNPLALTAVLSIAAGSPGGLSSESAPEGPVVVTSLTTYAAIAREIVGDRGEVSAIANGAENPHFVTPRPSLVLQVRGADLFVVTGLDLELWVPALLDRANNPRVREGAAGYVAAATGVDLLDVPASVSRAGGDIHVFGNPHIWTSPINAVIIGRNILNGLKRVAPQHSEYYEDRYRAWRERVMTALVGDEIVQLIGVDAAFNLMRDGRLLPFLASQSYQDRPLSDRLAGWLKRAEKFRGGHMVCYHKEWDYFSRAFDVSCDDYVEPKPGIPPTPQHVADIMHLMRERRIRVLLSTNYFDHKQVESVAERTGATAVIVPSNTEGAPGIDSYEQLVDLWVSALADAFAGG